MTHISDLSPDWTRSLPRDAFQEIMLVLRSALPPPVSQTPEDAARRDNAAMAAVASLRPENAAEGRLAAQFVAADAWALDCLRLAGERRREPELARKCRAQAMSLMREAKSSLRLLLRLQATRERIEADEAAASRAAWVEHGAVGMMEAALAAAPAGLDGAAEAGPEARSGAGERTFRFVAENATDSRNVCPETKPRFQPLPQGCGSSGDGGRGMQPVNAAGE